MAEGPWIIFKFLSACKLQRCSVEEMESHVVLVQVNINDREINVRVNIYGRCIFAASSA